MIKNLLECSQLSLKVADLELLKNVNFAVLPGEFVGLTGRNGVGKTSLLKTLIGYHRNYDGRIWFNGKDKKEMCQRDVAMILAYVPQSMNVFFDSPVRQMFSEVDSTEVKQLLSDLSAGEFLHRRFQSLSGGERQRILLASALSQNPKLILLDELTQYVDVQTTEFLGKYLLELKSKTNLSMLAVSHDSAWLSKFCDRQLLLDNASLKEVAK